MMLQDRRVCAAAAKDWVWTLNNPTAEVEEGRHRFLDLHCAYWVYGREVGQQGSASRNLIEHQFSSILSTLWPLCISTWGQIIGEQNPMLVMFTSYPDQITKENILADLNNPYGLVTVVLCTSALSVGVSVNCKTWHSHYHISECYGQCPYYVHICSVANTKQRRSC